MSKPDRAVCIHSHFYQPPRENPWREVIEAQDSASPFHDWNERIADECYAPYARARLLDREGQVRRVMNLYERTSFNVGPTLLAWMASADSATYRAILGADRESRSRFSGHGTGIAQAYGHAILPLAPRRDKLTQVRWGIRDFELRFGRRPEALWLPETAVDVETLEVLAAEALRYVLLAPHQVRRVRSLAGGAWQLVEAATLDTTIPYLVRLPSGASIAAFAYDGAIAHGVSFGNLLDSGDRFIARLLSALPRRGGLVHIATDGETYGHHHRFGEMALAYALEQLEVQGDVRLTNYGEWLDAHPPSDEAEIAADTSWSCAHGVERWRSNCSCTTYSRTGWDQAWRAPLRRAVDELNVRLDDVYESRAKSLLREPWAARDAYVDVVFDPATADAFLDAQASRPLGGAEREEALRLLEMQRHRLLAATSCGWYFADLAGLEAVQNLRYAARAIELAEGLGARGTEDAFVARLAEARSNEPALGDGRSIYERLARAAAVSPLRAVREHVVDVLYDRSRPAGAPLKTPPGIAVNALEQIERRTPSGRLVAGRAQTLIRRTRETADVAFAGIRRSHGVPRIGAALTGHGEGTASIVRRFEEDGPDAAADLVADAFAGPVRLEEILAPHDLVNLENDTTAAALLSINAADAALLGDPRATPAGELHGLALFVVQQRIAALARSLDSLDAMERLLEQAEALSMPPGTRSVAHELGRTVARAVSAWDPRALDPAALERAGRAAARARALAPDVNLWRAQEAYLQTAGRALGEDGSGLPRDVRSVLERLGDALGVRFAKAV